ncbi:MAG: S9 family peptidase [Deltaproteobacteria bacterium]|nr:S9 family peptidase [Deltaproteobacteria bacterium]
MLRRGPSASSGFARSHLPLAALVLLAAHCGREPDPKAPTASPSASVASAAPRATATLATSASSAPQPSAGPPLAAKKPVVDAYHGVQVTDDYRWLEGSKDAAVQAWSDAQSAWARKHLDALPGRDALRARFGELLGSASPDHFALHATKTKLFAIKDQPPKQQAMLVTLDSPFAKASEKVVLDPNELDPTGGTTIDWYVPSRDGKRVAVSLSKGGSESGDVHVYDVASGKELGAPIARVHGGTAGGSLTWNGAGTGFWYTRYPRAGERAAEDLDFYQQIWFHDLNGPKDRYALGKSFPRIAEIELATSHDGRFVLAQVANGDGGERAYQVLDTQKTKESKDGEDEKGWSKVSEFADQVVGAELGEDGGLWLRSIKDAPRGRLLRTAPEKPDLAKATVMVPERADRVIQSFLVRKERVYVADLVGGPSAVRVFSLAKGKIAPLEELPLPPVSSVRQLSRVEGNDGALVRTQSYTEPPAWYAIDAMFGTGVKLLVAPVRKTELFQTSKADYSDTEVVRDTCTSKDGTKVPISIIRRKGLKLDGANPTLLYGYGGYGVSLMPRFQPRFRPWLEAGGVVAIANLRGGGELGEDWHKAGMLTKKQNVFDDFFACGERLKASGYTRADKLAIMGGSNGGLLMGAAMVQHPEAFRAVVSQVGIFDMLRVETTPNGAFNVTEFGTVKDKAQFDALLAYSPYHHVKDGVKYPAVLFMTGANDPRVDPYHSRKMTARLQAASPQALVLLRTSGDTGHGMGTPLKAQIEEEVDQYAFLFAKLGMTAAAK